MATQEDVRRICLALADTSAETGDAPDTPEMTATDVCDFLDVMDARGVRIWLDGGWAVDAWLGGQPRRHGDLDIVVEQKDLATVVEALTERGFEPIERDDTRPWNFVLGDALRHQVDFHVVEIDDHGRGVYGPPDNGDFWPANALDRTTTLCGRSVHASGPEWLVASHTGYQLKDKDWRDVSALCARFGMPIPSEYEPFANA